MKKKYKTQALSTEQIIENLTVLFTVSDSSGDRLQDVLVRARDNTHTNRQFKNILEAVADTVQFKSSQALAVDWDQDNEQLLCTSSWHSIYAFQ